MNDILDCIRPTITSIISVFGAFTGTLTSVAMPFCDINTGFQHAAWTIAIIAGMFSIMNYIRNWVISDKSILDKKRKRHFSK